MARLFERRGDRGLVTDYEVRAVCALCGASDLPTVMSLGATPLANEFVSAPDVGKPQATFPLPLLLCGRCGHLQLGCLVDPARLFTQYVYVSGTSPVFVSHFHRYAADTIGRFQLGPRSFVVDIGSNDGTLLKQYQALGISHVLGVDPAIRIAEKAREDGVPTIVGFFTEAVAQRIVDEHGRAALVVANNVFAHAQDLAAIARGVRDILARDGVFVFEVSYLRDVLDGLLFDTIYHEHVSFHAVRPLRDFFAALGMRLFEAERIPTHGGSVRCYVARDDAPFATAGTIAVMTAAEETAGLFAPATYDEFMRRIRARAVELRRRLDAIPGRPKSVAGFGAPAKLTTLTYELGVTGEDVSFVIDDSPWKQGLRTPGRHIPVVASDTLYREMPSHCIVFAWNFADSIMRKHAEYRARGGRFIVPLPDLAEF